jgi:hypothetical protein
VAHELYNSEQNSGRDRPGLALRFNMACSPFDEAHGKIATNWQRFGVFGIFNRPAGKAAHLGH